MPKGRYRLQFFCDTDDELAEDWELELVNPEFLVGEIEIKSDWGVGETDTTVISGLQILGIDIDLAPTNATESKKQMQNESPAIGSRESDIQVANFISAMVEPMSTELATTEDATFEIQSVHPKTIEAQDGAQMVLVPEGLFQMGSLNGHSDEKPVRNVSLDAFLYRRARSHCWTVSPVHSKHQLSTTGLGKSEPIFTNG